MEFWQSIIMGLVQGLTEFLPVSSSAHLVFTEHFLHLRMTEAQTVSYDVLLHLGTLLAVLIYFRSDVWQLLKGAGALIKNPKVAWRENAFSRLFVLLIIGTIPAGIAGITLQPFFSAAFQNIPGTAALLFITAAMLIWITHRKGGNRGLQKANWKDALLIGLFQAIAILPGVSRSGSTITAGLLRGLDRDSAPRFSFLLSIPIILAGGLLAAKDVMQEGGISLPTSLLLAGFIAAAVSGYAAVVLLLGIIRRGKLEVFAYYCITVGIFMLAYWFLLVPKVDMKEVKITSALSNEAYSRSADDEFGPLELNRPVKIFVPVQSAFIPVKSVAILMPAHGKSNALALTPTGKDGEFQLANYPLRPIHAGGKQPVEDIRDLWLVMRNNWGIQNEVHLKVIVKNSEER